MFKFRKIKNQDFDYFLRLKENIFQPSTNLCAIKIRHAKDGRFKERQRQEDKYRTEIQYTRDKRGTYSKKK